MGAVLPKGKPTAQAAVGDTDWAVGCFVQYPGCRSLRSLAQAGKSARSARRTTARRSTGVSARRSSGGSSSGSSSKSSKTKTPKATKPKSSGGSSGKGLSVRRQRH